MSTTLKLSQAAEVEARQAKEINSLDSIRIPVNEDIGGDSEPEVRNILFKLVKKKKGRYYLDNSCDSVINPATKKPDMIWLLRGANSIWATDIENLLKDKNRYERSRVGMDIIFVNGVLRVASNDTLRLEFLRKHRKNVGKRRVGIVPGDYHEYDPAEEQRDRHAKQMMKIEMMFTARDMEIVKAKKLAAFLGVTFVDEVGMPKSDDAVRTELVLKADTDPANFQKYLNSREVETQWMVRRAIIEGRIDTGDGKGNITWANGKGFISRMPSTRKPLEYLTELALTNTEDGRRFREQLEQFGT